MFGFAAKWLFGDPMRELLDLFDERIPEPGTALGEDIDEPDWLKLNEELPSWLSVALGPPPAPTGLLRPEYIDILRRTVELERVVADDFDFRGRGTAKYRERIQASTADFDDALRARIVEATRRLGLVDPDDPLHDRYDMTLVLGGGYSSPQLRSKLAAHLGSMGVDLGPVYFLGSPRFLIEEPPEATAVAYYADGARDEFDLMCAGATREFGFAARPATFLCGCASADTVCPRWLEAHRCDVGDTPPEYTHERSAELVDAAGTPRGAVLSASTGRPPLRPDTTDTFALWAHVAEPHPGQRALIVTSQVFVPFQTFDGVKRLYLNHGVEVDAVGFGAEWDDRPKTAEYLLQETLSAIRSARRLLIDAAGVLR